MSNSFRRILTNKLAKRFVEVDLYDDSLIVSEDRHWKVHNGDLFLFDTRTSINAGASLNFLILTGACCVHAKFFGNPQRLTSFTLFQDPTYTGTINVQAKAMNRCNQKTAKSRFATEVVVTGTGTTLFQDYQGQSAGANRKLFGEQELILEPNTEYLFRGFNNAASAGLIHMGIEFYETLP